MPLIHWCALSGPTGVGKSAVAARAAALLGAEIVCADSRQLYRGLRAGSAQPSPAELATAPHHLYETLDPAEACSAGAFRALALPAMHAIAGRGRLPLLVGGTGLYLKALGGAWSLAPQAPAGLVAGLEARAGREGAPALWEELARRDPVTSRRVHPRDAYRIVRALAVLESTGAPISAWRSEHTGGTPPVALVVLNRPRSLLYGRIDARTARMMDAGMLAEARALRARGLDPARPPLNAIGYGHCARVLDGTLPVADAAALVARDTRRYAKRQLTWLRAQAGALWIEAGEDPEADAHRVAAAMRERLS